MSIFAGDGIGAHISVFGIFEKAEIDDFVGLLSFLGFDLSTKTIIDAGANIGNHSLAFSRYFKHVFAYEPNKRAYNLLKQNVQNKNNVSCFEYGLGKTNQSLELNENFRNIGGSSIIAPENCDNVLLIETKKLDDCFEDNGDLIAIKIDVEGMELSVLEGAEELITNTSPVIGFEQLETEFKSDNIETAAIDWLRERGFRMFLMSVNNGKNGLAGRLIRQLRIVIFGTESRDLIEFERLPPRSYGMIYAIHEKLFHQKDMRL